MLRARSGSDQDLGMPGRSVSDQLATPPSATQLHAMRVRFSSSPAEIGAQALGSSLPGTSSGKAALLSYGAHVSAVCSSWSFVHEHASS